MSNKIKTWHCSFYPCYCCKPYIQKDLFKCDHYILYFLWGAHLCQYIGTFHSYARPTSMCITFHLVWRSLFWCKWGISWSSLVLFTILSSPLNKEYNTVQYRCINADLKNCWYIHLHITTFSFKRRNWNENIFAPQSLLCITKQLKDLASYCRQRFKK